MSPVHLGPEYLDTLRGSLPRDDGTLPDLSMRRGAWETTRLAAVLVPLFVREDTIHVVLTKRTDNVRTHQGQVSFPGGGFEPSDVTLQRTALREAREEVGLRETDVEILGVMDDTPTNVSGFLVRPFVGTVPHPYEFVHDVSEVAHVFSPPLELFADTSQRREEVRERDGVRYPVWYYDVGGNIVWGATARMLVMLLSKLGVSAS